MMSGPEVAVVILNWNGYNNTNNCIKKVKESNLQNTSIVLVDNGSSDGSYQRLLSEWDLEISIRNQQNLGFGGGMNTGIKQALESLDPSYILVLNNDAEINGDELEDLVNIAEEHPDIGVLSPRITQEDSVYFEQGYIDWSLGNTGHRQVQQCSSDKKLVENDYIPLCAALIRSEVFETVGLIPEEYFLYFEDIDFCIQVRKAGFRLVTDLGTEIYHESGGSTGGGMSPIPSYYTARNRWYLFHDKYGNQTGPLFSLNHHLRVFGRVAIQGKNRNLEGVSATLRGWMDGLRGSVGKGPYPKRN